MDLYLAQHGEASLESEDPARPLNERGRQEVERVSRAAAGLGLGLALIGHSGKLRAQQTAEIFGAALHPAGGVREMPGLAPNDDPSAVARAVAGASEPWLLVGHLPHLGRLLSLLVFGDPTRDVVAFRMGGVVALRKEEAGFRVRFILTPEIARD